MRKQGRPKLPPGQHKVFKVVRMDEAVLKALTAHIDKLEARLGFRPTLAQTVKMLLNNVEDL